MKAESNSPPGGAKASDGLSLLAAAVEHERFVPHCLLTANGLNYDVDDDQNRKSDFYSSGSVLAPAPPNGMDAASAAKSNAFRYLNGLLPFPRASLLINGSTMTSLAPHFSPKMVENEKMIGHSTMKPNEALLKMHINSNRSRSPDSTEFSDSQAIVQPISNSNIDSTIHQISSQINDKSYSSNSKQYLRYKLLERQNRLNASSSQIAVNEKIAAVDVKNREERSSKVGVFKSGRFSAFTPCSSTGGGGTLSVKECLSTLSINVGCPGRTNVSPTNSAFPTNVIQQQHQPKSIETPPSVVVAAAAVESQLPSSSSKSLASPPATNATSTAVSSSSPGGVSWSSDDQQSSSFLRVQRPPPSSRRNSSAAALAPTAAVVQHQPPGKRRRTSEPSLERRRLSSGDECGNGAAGASERYVERRRRNNEAAKRCRANRRALFDYRSRQSLELERENLSLRQTVKELRQELQELRSLLRLRTSTAERAVGVDSEAVPAKNLTTATANGHYEASVENTSSEDETPLDFSTKKSQIR